MPMPSNQVPQVQTPPVAVPHETTEDAEIQELKKITEELKAVNANTGSSWTAFLRGMLSGGGAIIGSIVAIILIGVVLSVLGVIPGFHTIADYINAAIANVKHY
jgi:hypothetical protein